MQKRFAVFAFSAVTLLSCPLLGAWPAQSDHVEAELLSDVAAVAPGRPFTVALRLKMEEHWHTYWRNPGDSGMPTTIAWTLPTGFAAGPIQWPAPRRIPTPPFMTYGYEGEVFLLTEITPPADLAIGSPVEVRAAASWLVCKESCVPGDVELALELPTAAGARPADAGMLARFEAARGRLPGSAGGWRAWFEASAGVLVLRATPPAGVTVDPAEAYFFPNMEALIEAAQPQVATLEDGHLVLRLIRPAGAEPAPPTLEGVLVVGDRAVSIAAGPRNTAAGGGFGLALGLAFLGGLILNLMPCVFPVLGIKILGFVNQSGADRRKVSLHGLVFTVGVVVSFWILAGTLLALRAGGEELGWGFQLQSPAFVFALTVLLLVFALNLSGLFEVGLSATGVGGTLQMRTGYAGTFFTGVLATVVATPCSAPFLAPALGAALALPPVRSIVLFTAIAVGLSAPYLVLSVFPGLVRHLPRPGPWMETFKQLMAFLLYATVAYFVWVLAGQTTDSGFRNLLWALVLVALATWIYGHWGQRPEGGGRRALGMVAALVALAAGIAFGYPSRSDDEIVWQKWSPEAVARLQGEGRIIYVDFTARWCVTCQSNKALVFSSDDVREAFRTRGVVPLKADWTNRDPEITSALLSFGRSAVPLNLVYLPGRSSPLVLPEVLTAGVVLEAIGSSAPARSAGR